MISAALHGDMASSYCSNEVRMHTISLEVINYKVTSQELPKAFQLEMLLQCFLQDPV